MAKSKNKQQIKDPDAPKRPKSGYFFFMSEVRPKVKKQNPNTNSVELGRIMYDMWKKLGEKDKALYNKKADKDKERYAAEKARYVPPTPALPKDWSEAHDPATGKTYYYNHNTGEATWTRPEGPPLPPKKKKDPDAPKRAKSAYFFFMDAVREKTKKANPTATVAEMGRLMGQAWAKVAVKDKQRYEAMAQKDKMRYEAEREQYERTKGMQMGRR